MPLQEPYPAQYAIPTLEPIPKPALTPSPERHPTLPSIPSIDTTIVLSTCDRVALLDGALRSLLAQTWARRAAVELVVVDDGSTDNTSALLGSLAATAAFPFRVVPGPAQGIAAARNAGVAAARGRWIASFDDDQIADPDWLLALRTRADAAGAVCVGGALNLLLPPADPADPVARALGPRVRAVLGEHHPYTDARVYARPFHPATNNALLRRDLLVAGGGFDTRFTEGGEDKELFRRLQVAGHPLWFEPAARAGHITPPSRLTEVNLRWTSRRLGASDARFGLLAGPLRSSGHMLVRALAAPARDLPRLLLNGPEARLDTLCSLWYTEGLIRAHLALAGPHRGASAFLQSLNFRVRNGERTA